jgi:hypothetical protein
MNFTELRDEVFLITKRPDLVTQTESAVRKATLRLHDLDYWSKDAVDVVLTWTVPAYQQEWTPKTTTGPLTGSGTWRSLRYAVKASATGEAYGKPLEYWEPGIGTYDAYGHQKSNVWYESGTKYLFQFSDLPPKLLVGGYTRPIITAIGWNSWISEDHPYAIIYDAALTVLTSIGFTEVARDVAGQLAIEIANLKTSAVQSVGY